MHPKPGKKRSRFENEKNPLATGTALAGILERPGHHVSSPGLHVLTRVDVYVLFRKMLSMRLVQESEEGCRETRARREGRSSSLALRRLPRVLMQWPAPWL